MELNPVRHNFSAPVFCTTDFVFIMIIISAGTIRQWKLQGYYKAPVDDDPRQEQYKTTRITMSCPSSASTLQ